ncbi:MAG: hypothetical protein ABS899_06550 [Desemzia incerta]
MSISSKGSYTITVNETEKKVFLFVSGKAEPEAIQGFFNDYSQTVSDIKPSEYELVVDCKEMQVETPDMLEQLAASFNLYKETGFKEITFEVNSAILKMQINRIVRQVNLTNANVVEV